MAQVKVTVLYYSATGTNYPMAIAAQQAAEQEDAEVRLRKVRELAPDSAIDANPAWRAHADATRDVLEVTGDDMDWADAYTDPKVFAAGGNPYGVSATTDPEHPQVSPEVLQALGHMTRRVVHVAQQLRTGRAQ